MQNAGGLERFDEFSILLGKRKRSRRGYASCTFLAPHFEYFTDIDLIEGFSYVADLWDRTHMQLSVDGREQRFCLRNFQIEVCHCFDSQRGASSHLTVSYTFTFVSTRNLQISSPVVDARALVSAMVKHASRQ